MIAAARTAPTIHQVRWLFGRRNGAPGPSPPELRPRDFRPPAEGSASKISPGPAFVPTGAPARPGAIAVESEPTAAPAAVAAPAAAAPPASTTTPESVSSDTPGARNALIGAESSSRGVTNGKAEGVGSAAASAPSRAANPAASRREATSGAAARASTSSSGPSASSCGSGWPMRAASVPMVVSVTKGTVPVTAS